MYHLNKKRKIQFKNINFNCQIFDITGARRDLIAFPNKPNSFEKALDIVTEKYKGRKIEIIEDSDYMSDHHKRIIMDRLGELL